MSLSSSFLFRGLSASQLQRVYSIVDHVVVPKNQWLIHEGREGDRVYILKSGSVEMLTRINGEYELPIRKLRAEGSCFGTSGLVAPHEYSLSARSAEDVGLLEIKRADLEALSAEDGALGCTIMKNLAQHLLAKLKETRMELKTHFQNLSRSMHT